MRGNLSDELLNTINERIYLDLELNVINSKLIQAEKDGKEGFTNHLHKLYSNVSKQRKEINAYLKENGVKIHEVEVLDDMFVRYKYHQRLHGGFKEGDQMYWKAGMKLELKRRMSKYFGGE